MGLRIEIRQDSRDVTVCMITGRLDSDTAAQLEETLDRIIESETTHIVFDLAGLEYISSAGLRSIFRAKRAMAQRDGLVNVVNMAPSVQKVFDIVKAVPVESIFKSWDELDEYLDKIQRQGDGA